MSYRGQIQSITCDSVNLCLIYLAYKYRFCSFCSAPIPNLKFIDNSICNVKHLSTCTYWPVINNDFQSCTSHNHNKKNQFN